MKLPVTFQFKKWESGRQGAPRLAYADQ